MKQAIPPSLRNVPDDDLGLRRDAGFLHYHQARSRFWYKLVLVAIAFTPLLGAWLSYSLARAQLENDFRHLVESISRFTAAAIDAEKHARLVSAGPDSPEHIELLGLLNDLQKGFPEIADLATLIIRDDQLYYTLDTADLREVSRSDTTAPAFLKPYQASAPEQADMVALLRDGDWYAPELRFDRTGALQGACSRVRQIANAEPTLVCLTIAADTYLQTLDQLQENSLLGIVVMLAGSLFLLYSVLQNQRQTGKAVRVIERQRDIFLANSRTDPLTGVLSRRAFDSVYAAAQAQFHRNNLPFALFYIDIDNFKRINDTYGHDIGDELLRRFAESLLKVMRPSDILIRMGGDEFAIICNLSERAQALAMGEKLREAAGRMQVTAHDGTSVTTSISLGVHLVGNQDSQLVAQKNADIALYQAKRGGRDRVVCFEPGMEGDSKGS